MNLSIPSPVAVGIWAAFAIIVTSYTVKAFSATRSGTGGASLDPATSPSPPETP